MNMLLFIILQREDNGTNTFIPKLFCAYFKHILQIWKTNVQADVRRIQNASWN